MLNLFQSGFVAAGFQLIAVMLATPVVLALMRPGSLAFLSTSFGSDATAPSMETQSSLLTGAYLILSLGVVLTENQLLDSTAMHIRRISHLKDFPRPYLVMGLLLFLFCLGAAGFVTLALQAPPKFLVDLGRDFGWDSRPPIIWPGTMSIGVAWFGGNAHATLRALQW
jgi:hypothetical protein